MAALESNPSAGGSSAAATPVGHDMRGEGFSVILQSFVEQNRAVVFGPIGIAAMAFDALIIILCLISSARMELLFVMIICHGGFIVAAVWCLELLDLDDGTPAMIAIANAIREGSEGFISTQYRTIGIISAGMSVVIFCGFLLRSPPPGYEISQFTMAISTCLAFIFGAGCSAAAGYVGLWISVRVNCKVSQAAVSSYVAAIKTALTGGAIAALVVVGMVNLGVTILYVFFSVVVVGAASTANRPEQVPMLMVGYGFGASFVALFAQLGGGIFTKGADVGADLVGKVEQDIPEDDPRNPAVIADLVGDNVGDCAGRGADLFESIGAEIISAMILGGTLSKKSGLTTSETGGYVLFPLLIHAFDLVVSCVGVFSVRRIKAHESAGEAELGDPMSILKKGYLAAGACGFLTFMFACRWLLYAESAPYAWMHFAGCGTAGMVAAYLNVLTTQYYTDYKHAPVKSIAEASNSGHATNIIFGVAVGLESTAIPVVIVSVAVLTAYWTGTASGLKASDGTPTGGLFGTAVATMGMLSTAVYVLAMDFFGPIADNAGGIIEMSDLADNERVRNITDQLDAVGNTTKAATKGYAIGSAALACFLLFSAFMDEVSQFTGVLFNSVDIAVPEIFIAGLLGAMLVFLFSSWTILAVGDTARAVVVEVRRQFQENPGIMTGTVKPDYTTCVAIVTQKALRSMIKPGLLAVGFPITVGMFFRFVGAIKGDVLLGAKCVSSLLMFGTVAGILMALFMNNAGGAWDNAKKLVETGECGGKGSEAHKAAVTGDTVGDPFKDTAGPSIHVLIKLLSTVTLVMCPIFIGVAVEVAVDPASAPSPPALLL